MHSDGYISVQVPCFAGYHAWKLVIQPYMASRRAAPGVDHPEPSNRRERRQGKAPGGRWESLTLLLYSSFFFSGLFFLY